MPTIKNEGKTCLN